MQRHDSSVPTMRMCRFIGETEPPCHGPYRWMLESDGVTFVVCDSHLAEGIRKSGLPAYIESQPISGSAISVQTITAETGDA